MNYNHPRRNTSTLGIRLMCAIVFCVFSFSFLYWFQADVLAVAQHVLSNGLTKYKPFLGAFVITLVLQAIQIIIYSLIRLQKRFHALTYLPSMLILGFITDVNSDIDLQHSIGHWYWVFPLVILIWLGVALLAKQVQEVEPDNEPLHLLSRPMWISMLLMALLIIGVVSVSNTNAVFHYRMSAESRLIEGDYAGALELGKKSLESDEHLQMIRMYALNMTGQLGEKLFSYPTPGKSEDILPVEGKSRFAMYPTDSLYKTLGAKPKAGMTVAKYLELMLRRDSVDDKKIADYQLCGLLLDKRLDEFVSQLKTLYSENDTLIIDHLPKHYREAMTLYTHKRSNPILVYHNSVMDEDWSNLQELESKYPDLVERKGKVEEKYRGTYWYYYEYE